MKELNLGTAYPLIQAPMAGSQGSKLALAVGQSGGLGSLPCAMLSNDELEREVKALTTLSSYNLNFFCHDPAQADLHKNAAKLRHWQQQLAPFYAEFGLALPDPLTPASRQPFSPAQAELLAPYRPPVVSFHFGLPAPALLGQVKSWGSRVLATACSLEEALALERSGADGIILQGLEAGGHRGHFLRSNTDNHLSTLELLAACRAKVSLPLIAAGGISQPQDCAQAMAAGASAVQVGTAYLLCPEAKTSTVHRRAIERAVADPSCATTALTNLFSGRPARGLNNALMASLGALRTDLPAFPLCSGSLAPLRSAAEAAGRGDFSPLWAGVNVSRCRAIGAAQLTRELGAACLS